MSTLGKIHFVKIQRTSTQLIQHISISTSYHSASILPAHPQPSSSNDALNSQDRWRIPVIFAKVGKNAPLSANDARIWAAFVRGKSEEDVLASVASALSEQLPEDYLVVDDAEQHALQDTIQAASMPSNTPFPSSAAGHPSAHEMPGRMVSSRSLSDFSKLDSLAGDDDAELFSMPPMARTQSYNCSGIGSSPRHAASAGVHRDGEIGPPSPRKNRAPLPRSGTNSKLSSPTAKSGIADMSSPPAPAHKCVQVEVSKPLKGDKGEKLEKVEKGGHKRVVSLSVLDTLADALQRGLGLHVHPRDPYVRTDTASSESDLGVERGVSVDEHSVGGSVSGSVGVSVSAKSTGGVSRSGSAGGLSGMAGVSGGTGWGSSGVGNSSIAASASSKKTSYTPPVSPREAQDPFPPHSDYVTPARRHSYTVSCASGASGATGASGVGGSGHSPLQVLQAMQSDYSTMYHTSPISNHHSQHTPHALSPLAQNSYVAQVPLKVSPPSAKNIPSSPSSCSPVQVSSRSGSVSGSSSGKGSTGSGNNGTTSADGASEEVHKEVRHRRQHSRSPSPSFLRTLASWGGGSGGSSRVVPGSWEDENFF